MAFPIIAIFNRERIPMQDHRDPMKWIAMPGQCLARRKLQTTHERGSTLKEHFIDHVNLPQVFCTFSIHVKFDSVDDLPPKR
jgi:hypothetical protein